MISVPPEIIPHGMKAVHIGTPFQSTAIEELKSLDVKRVFVIANRSSSQLIAGLMNQLREMNLLIAPLCTSIGMGGDEIGLMQACDEAYASGADCVVSVGGGAVQDAGKLIRLWLSTKWDEISQSDPKKATVKALQEACTRNPMPVLPPQIAVPNSFAMAEATHVAGLTTTSKIKSGATHPCLMPTIVIYDAALSKGLPDWVRFGTAVRGIEHACGAITHPNANEEIRSRALHGLSIINENLKTLIANPECNDAQCNVYFGGFIAVRALSTGCYPALGHLIENHYSAKFDVHQGSCSGILCARIMNYHKDSTAKFQNRISAVLGDPSISAPRLMSSLVAKLPGVSKDHPDENITTDMLKEFSQWEFDNHIDRVNMLSPKKFNSASDIFNMMTDPLENL